MEKIHKAIMDVYPLNHMVLIDIGARWGVQRPWNNYPKNHLLYYGFDADEEECKRLNLKKMNNLSAVYFPNALLNKKSDKILFITQEEGCSSIYKPNFKIIDRYYYKENWIIKKEVRIKTTTLQSVFKNNNIDPDFIKIDTQGAELDILKGAGSYLGTVLGLELEVEFIQMYQGQPLFSDVDSFVRNKGFELFDLNRYWAHRIKMGKYHCSRGQVVFGDAIYFRSPESFYSMDMTKPQRKEKLLKLALMLSLYGYYDAAVDYINHSSSPLNDNEKSTAKDIFSKISAIPVWQRILFNNKVANKLGRVLMLVGNILNLRLNTHGWGTDYNAIDGRHRYFISKNTTKY